MPASRRAIPGLRFQTPNLKSSARPVSPRRSAFTLLELLVVIGIIVLLAAILVPVVSQIRMKGYVATTEAQMQRIAAAVQSYYHDFKAYPGPLANSQLTGWNAPSPTIVPDPNAGSPPITVSKITSSENLILGLYGCLSPPDSAGQPVKYSGFPPKHDVLSLNPVRPTSYHYIDYVPEELSQSFSLDSEVPEFLDHIPDYPNAGKTILYIRANVGVQPQAGVPGSGIASKQVPPPNPVQYDASQLAPYGFTKVNYDASGKGDYVMPQGVTATPPDDEWVAYFMNPNVVGQPRGKDAFVLISAGPDHLYGTKDDIFVTP